METILCIAVLILILAVLSKLFFFANVDCDESRVDGKTVVVTGGNCGIGLETAIELARRGAKIIVIGCRDLKKAKEAAKRIKGSDGSSLEVHLIHLDLGNFGSVRKFSESVKRISTKIHILVNNAGVMIGESQSTDDGLEVHMGVNYVGHFLLTRLLLNNLVKGAEDQGESRIINVSSDGHKFTMLRGLDVDHPRFGYADWAFQGLFRNHRLYGQSKLAQIYHAKELSRRFLSKGIISVSLHPGAVKTEITRYHQSGLGSLPTAFINMILDNFGKSPSDGAKTTVHCCVAPDLRRQSGEYFVDCRKVDIFPWLENRRKEELLWQKSDKIIGWTSKDE